MKKTSFLFVIYLIFILNSTIFCENHVDCFCENGWENLETIRSKIEEKYGRKSILYYFFLRNYFLYEIKLKNKKKASKAIYEFKDVCELIFKDQDEMFFREIEAIFMKVYEDFIICESLEIHTG